VNARIALHTRVFAVALLGIVVAVMPAVALPDDHEVTAIITGSS
jgi:hypothetical protein